MKYYLIVFLIILLFNSCDQEDIIQIEVEKGVVINSITIISATKEKVDRFLGYVVIDGERIVFANKKKPKLSGKFEEINGKGRCLIKK